MGSQRRKEVSMVRFGIDNRLGGPWAGEALSRRVIVPVCLLAIAAAIGGACRKEAPSASAAAASHPPAQAAEAPTPEEKPLALTDAKLDAWMTSMRKAFQLTKQASAQLEKQRGGGLARTGRSLATLYGAGKEYEAIRKESGLTDFESQQIGELVTAVYFQRGMDKAQPIPELKPSDLKAIEVKLAALPADQRKEAEAELAEQKRSLEEARRAQQDMATLRNERAKFGDAAVDLALRRQPDIEKLWGDLFEKSH
jgi:hypothetical protein